MEADLRDWGYEGAYRGSHVATPESSLQELRAAPAHQPARKRGLSPPAARK